MMTASQFKLRYYRVFRGKLTLHPPQIRQAVTIKKRVLALIVLCLCFSLTTAFAGHHDDAHRRNQSGSLIGHQIIRRDTRSSPADSVAAHLLDAAAGKRHLTAPTEMVIFP